MFSKSIQTQVFFLHLALVLLLLSGLSYKHYLDSIENYKKSQIEYLSNNALPIVTKASLAIAGENYANIQLPSFVQSLQADKKILFLKIEGESDRSKKRFSALYTQKIGKMFRLTYPKNYEKKLHKKITKLQHIKDTRVKNSDKIDFLLTRYKQLLQSYYESTKSQSKISQHYKKILEKNAPYFDDTDGLLYLSFTTHNKHSGKVSIVYNIAEMQSIPKEIIKNLLQELLLAVIFSTILFYFVSLSTVKPLQELTCFINKDFTMIEPKKIPFQKKKNEIGILSRSFTKLITKVQETYLATEKKANIDALTGIYNRNKFDEIFATELANTKRDKDIFSIALADIDHFKDFNDTYGHLIGDEVLIKVAHCLQENIRENDVVVRWGGEELVVLFRATGIEDAKVAADKLRQLIASIKNKNSKNITVSFGVTQYREQDTQESMFKRCDDALYLAKENGRNRVEVSL